MSEISRFGSVKCTRQHCRNVSADVGRFW